MFRYLITGVTALAVVAILPEGAISQGIWPLIKREQLRIEFRDPSSLPSVYVSETAAPPTVADFQDREQLPVSLDEAIRIALEQSEVVRALAGNLAVSSGRTIYDPAIAATAIDEARATFDPALSANHTWSQSEPPVAVPDPVDPTRTRFGGTKTDGYELSLDASQTNLSGGTGRLQFRTGPLRFSPGVFPLNPQNRHSTEVSYTQPLLQGAGVAANRVPIVLARIDAERSFFQFRDSIQELVRGVIEAYWALVFARTDVWARRIQVEQGQASYNREKARLPELSNVADVAQAETALARFRANLIAAESSVLQREAALRNILGIAPAEPPEYVPTTPPTTEPLEFDWNEIVRLAEQRRPDLIELKLILEADRHRLLLSRNQARPRLDAFALYRWNGLEGRMPSGSRTATTGDAFTDWTLGVNFSVPMLLRRERSGVRSSELLIARDTANLQQGIHAVRHQLAFDLRNLVQFYAQYKAFRIARKAAKVNLERQFAAYRTGNPVLFLNVLQAITDWGNSVSQEAQALTRYNTELADLERDTGTILETHAIWMHEDRFCSLGPQWLWKQHRAYPRAIRPGTNQTRYPESKEASENFFDLDDYPRRTRETTDSGEKSNDSNRAETESQRGTDGMADHAEANSPTPGLIYPPSMRKRHFDSAASDR